MKTIETNVLDSNMIRHDQASKILFADSLIEYFAPLFYEELRKKQEQFSNNMTDVKKLRTIITEQELKLVNIKNEIELESMKNQILKEIEYLIKIDVLYGKTKLMVQNIVNTLDSQSTLELKKRLILLQRETKEKENKRG